MRRPWRRRLYPLIPSHTLAVRFAAHVGAKTMRRRIANRLPINLRPCRRRFAYPPGISLRLLVSRFLGSRITYNLTFFPVGIGN